VTIDKTMIRLTNYFIAAPGINHGPPPANRKTSSAAEASAPVRRAHAEPEIAHLIEVLAG